MIKSFVWTLVFWTLFVLFNSIGDAIDFYKVFPWYGNMDLWHLLKYFWIGFAVLTGWFAHGLAYSVWLNAFKVARKTEEKIKYKLKTIAVSGFFFFWFLILRWILHETFMWIWRQP
jgi:hypothetical protein